MATADDDYDAPRQELSGMDKYYTNMFVLAIIVSICCGLIGLVVNVIGFFTCKDAKAKNNALICLIISGVLVGLGIVLQLTGALANLGNR